MKRSPSLLRLSFYFQMSRGYQLPLPMCGGDRSSLLRLSFCFQTSRGYQLPLPVWEGPNEFAEIIVLLPNEQGLPAPSPCVGRTDRVCLDYRYTSKRAGAISSLSLCGKDRTSLLRLSFYFQTSRGYQLPLPMWEGPNEFAEIIVLLPNEQGLSAPSPCGRGLG
jgi:hypothetical protein